ncbi:MAG: hypothetical protein QXJ62_05005 [Nitrososphaeria archaeon]
MIENKRYHNFKFRDPDLSLSSVCFNCGSFDIELLNHQNNKSVYKCRICGKVWIKKEKSDEIEQK